MLGDLFYRLGAAMGALDTRLAAAAGFESHRRPRQVALYDTEDGDDLDHDIHFEDAAIAGMTAWLLSRVLRPRPVSWPRVIFAGVTAATLADLVGRARDGTESATATGSPPHAEDPEELMARLGAGIAIAAGYAALIYPRLPGPPLIRGLVFGGLETLAAPRGGVLGLATRSAPGLRFPLQALALPVDEDAEPASHLAFGLALGALYRYDRD